MDGVGEMEDVGGTVVVVVVGGRLVDNAELSRISPFSRV